MSRHLHNLPGWSHHGFWSVVLLVPAQSQTLAEGVSQQAGDSDLQADWLYRILYGRPAGGAEVATLAVAFANLTDSGTSQQGADGTDIMAAHHSRDDVR